MSELPEKFWIFTKDLALIVNFQMDKNTGDINLSHELRDGEDLIFYLKKAKIEYGRLKENRIFSYNIGWAKLCYYFLMDAQLVLIYQASLKIKEKKIQETCNNLEKIFNDLYVMEDIERWDGDPSYFEDFYSRVKVYFKMSYI